MPDDVKDQKDVKDATPAVDVEKLQAGVTQGIKDAMKAIGEELKTAQEATLTKDAEVEPGKVTPGADFLGDAINKAIQPHLKGLQDNARAGQMAQDAAIFYSDPANSEAFEHRKEIEALVASEGKRGQIVTREIAWKYLRGGDLFETVTAKRNAAAKQREEEARFAHTAGPGVSRTGGGVGAKELTGDAMEAMPREQFDQLEQVLKDVPF
mgnify:FL=1